MSGQSDDLSRQKAIIAEIFRALEDATAEVMRCGDYSTVVGMKQVLKDAVARLKETTDLMAVNTFAIPQTPPIPHSDGCSQTLLPASIPSQSQAERPMQSQGDGSRSSTSRGVGRTESAATRPSSRQPPTWSGPTRNVRQPRMPLSGGISSSVDDSAATENSEDRERVRKLKHGVPPLEIHVKNTDKQIYHAAAALAASQAGSISSARERTDSRGKRRRTDTGVDSQARGAEGGGGNPPNTDSQGESSQTQQDDGEKRKKLELFVKVAADWRVMDPSLLQFQYRRPVPLPSSRDIGSCLELTRTLITSHHAFCNFLLAEAGRNLSMWSSEDRGIVSKIYRLALERKADMYYDILQDCGCQRCSSCHRWEVERKRLEDTLVDSSQASFYSEERRPSMCPESQLRMDYCNSQFAGLSDTNLKRTMDMASVVLPGEGLSVVCAPMSKVFTACGTYLKPALDEMPKVIASIPSFQVFDHIQPVGVLMEVDKLDLHFFDGDGTQVPTSILRKFAELNGISTPMDRLEESHGRVKVRFPFVDCPEIKDVYNIQHRSTSTSNDWTTSERHHLGLEALRFLRGIVYRADRVYLALPLNIPANRNLVAIPVEAHKRAGLDLWFTDGNYTSRTSVSLVLLKEGHAIVDNRFKAPIVAHAVENIARQKELGMFKLPQEILTEPSSILPWECRAWRETGMIGDKRQVMQNPLHSVKVTTSELATESLVFVAPSTARDAGSGLFLKPRRHEIFRDKYLCLYSSVRYPDMHSVPEASVDYLLDVGGAIYDGEDFDHNYGRYCNDLEIDSTIAYAVQQADKQTMGFFELKDVLRKSQESATAKFIEVRQGADRRLVLRSTKSIPPGDALELSVSYGFVTFWCHGVSLQPHHFCARIADPILWLILSDHSNLSKEQRKHLSYGAWTEENGLPMVPTKGYDIYKSSRSPPGLNTKDFI